MNVHSDRSSRSEPPSRPDKPDEVKHGDKKDESSTSSPPSRTDGDAYEASTGRDRHRPDLSGGGTQPPVDPSEPGPGRPINPFRRPASPPDPLEQARALHINQFDADVASGGNGRSANCGPASLAMALDSVGLQPAGATDQTPANERVDLARQAMLGGVDPANDGVDENGARVEEESEGVDSYTTTDDVIRGAEQSGAVAVELDPPTAEAIAESLRSGSAVVVSGTFEGKDPLPWTDDRPGRAGAPGGATDHLIAVTGYDEATGELIVNDPARAEPLRVDAETLESFMSGDNAGAVAISSPPPPPPPPLPRRNIPV